MKKVLISIIVVGLLMVPLNALANHNKGTNYKCEKIQKYYDKYLKKGKLKYLKKWEKKKAKYCPTVVQPTVPNLEYTVYVGNSIYVDLPQGYILEQQIVPEKLMGNLYTAGAVVGVDVLTYYIVVNGMKSNVGTLKINIVDAVDF